MGTSVATLGLAIWGEASCMLMEHVVAQPASRSG